MKKFNFNTLKFSDGEYDVEIKLVDNVTSNFNTLDITINETVELDGVNCEKRIYKKSWTNGEHKSYHTSDTDKGEPVWNMISEKYRTLIETFYTTFAK